MKNRINQIGLTALIILALVVIIVHIVNAIIINQSIPTLDKWDSIATGNIDCGYTPKDDCYQSNSKFIYRIGGAPLVSYVFYTPLSAWYGFETADYSDLSYHHIYRLYKHDSIIPFRTEYLVVCVY